MLKNVKAQAAAALHIPQDVIPGEPIVTVTGRQKILVFQEEEIRLQARTCRIVIRGKRLQIAYYTKDDMLIGGQISSVCMEA